MNKGDFVALSRQDACPTNICESENGSIAFGSVTLSRQDACPTNICESENGSIAFDSVALSRQDACSTNTCKTASVRITRRRLPHWQMDGAIYFITFNTWEKLELNEAARKAVLDSCLFFDGQRYSTFAVVVMPDHIHWLLQPLPKSIGECWSLSEIMHSTKSYSAKQIPKVMKHIGTVWQLEWYDRIVRDEEELQNTRKYIRQNPVAAGLCNAPESYPFLWEKSDRPDQSNNP